MTDFQTIRVSSVRLDAVFGGMSCTGADEAGGNDDARSGDDRRGDVGGGRFPRGAYLGQEDGNSLQPHDPAALQAGSSEKTTGLPKHLPPILL